MTVIKIKGDTDAIIEQMSQVEPVFRRVGSEHGAVAHMSARTDDGVIIVNLWRDAEGSEAAAAHPDVQEALAGAMSATGAQPDRSHYEVIESYIA
jgi:hypothetical protein